MIVILFGSKLTAAAGADDAAMDERMFARASAAPGFIEIKSYRSDDGERLTIVWWKDADSFSRWRNDPEHRVAQETGRARWYAYDDMELAQVVQESHFARAAVNA